MQIWRVISLLVLGVVCVSCHSTDPEARYQAWLLSAIKGEAASHKHVILVCVYESRFQRLPLPSKHHLDTKATVVRSYKGDWRVGERVELHRELESAPEGWKPGVGHLQFLLLDEHTSSPVGIDVGQDWDYTPEFDRELQIVYSPQERR